MDCRDKPGNDGRDRSREISSSVVPALDAGTQSNAHRPLCQVASHRYEHNSPLALAGRIRIDALGPRVGATRRPRTTIA